MDKRSIPVQVALRFRRLGHDVVSVSLSASYALAPYDAAYLLELILGTASPDGFVCRQLFDNSFIIFGSDDKAATPLSCCTCDVLHLPISMSVELADGALHGVTFDLTKGTSVRDDCVCGDDRIVRFVGSLSLDDDIDETEE